MAIRLTLAVGLLALLWAVAVPDEPPFHLCGFLWLTGLPCPLCGLTRGLFALAKGHWAAALRFHPLTPLALAMILSLFAGRTLRSRVWMAGCAAFGVFGAMRLALGI